MAQIGYSKKVMEYFMNPRNVGTIENPDGHGKVGSHVCGDSKPSAAALQLPPAVW